MKQRLVISSIVAFPVLLLVSRFLFDKSWTQSFLSAAFQEVFYFTGFYLYILWQEKKAVKDDAPEE